MLVRQVVLTGQAARCHTFLIINIIKYGIVFGRKIRLSGFQFYQTDRRIAKLRKQLFTDIAVSISAVQLFQQHLTTFPVGYFIQKMQYLPTVGNRVVGNNQFTQFKPVLTYRFNQQAFTIQMGIFPEQITLHGDGALPCKGKVVAGITFGRSIRKDSDGIDARCGKTVGEQGAETGKRAWIVHIVILHQRTVLTEMKQ